jgi:Leucine-rich repeat (LRR) protein
MCHRSLDVSNNQLAGSIPFSIGSLAAVTSLTLDHNRITDVPLSVLSLVALRFVNFVQASFQYMCRTGPP